MANSKPERLDDDPEVDAKRNIRNAEVHWKGGKKGTKEKRLSIRLLPPKTLMGKRTMPIIVTISHGKVVEPFPVAAEKSKVKYITGWNIKIGRIIIPFLLRVKQNKLKKD